MTGRFIKRIVVIFLAVAGIGVAVTGMLFAHFLDSVNSPVQLQPHERTIEIVPGSSIRQIGRLLESQGIIKNSEYFRLAARYYHLDRTIKTGEYQFSGAYSVRQVLEKLHRGDIVLHSIMFPEGYTIRQMTTVWENADVGTGTGFLEAAQLAQINGHARPETGWEGYLFPSTYHIPRNTSARDMVTLMHQQLLATIDASWLSHANAFSLNLHQILTLASLIEEETSIPEERGLVSSVFHNRLKSGMLLQCDPTVVYALGESYSGRLLTRHLDIDSPYNTYRYPGLPPGPISNPGAASIYAACFPAETDYYYFVANTDGGHVFSRNLREHNRAVAEYRRNRKTK